MIDYANTVKAKDSRALLWHWSATLILLFTSGPPLGACLWTTGTTKDATHVTVSGYSPAKQLRHSMRANLLERGAAMESELKDARDITNRNDYAVSLIWQGRYTQAIEVLAQLEKERPGQYFTAANLGTAYELAGRDEAALQWIKEGIRRNKDSHAGTEWLHVKILEAKLQAAREPDYFKHHSVLDLDFSRIERDAKSLAVGGGKRTVAEVRDALRYQLQERLQFVRSQDGPVASLLFDYAAITAATHSLEAAKELLQLAAEYGYPQAKVLPLLVRYDRIIALAKVRRGLLVLGFGLLAVSFIVYAVKRRWIVLQAKS